MCHRPFRLPAHVGRQASKTILSQPGPDTRESCRRRRADEYIFMYVHSSFDAQMYLFIHILPPPSFLLMYPNGILLVSGPAWLQLADHLGT